jgi:hypothetical protein
VPKVDQCASLLSLGHIQKVEAVTYLDKDRVESIIEEDLP